MFPFVNIKINPKKLEESCEIAKALDDYLYKLCRNHAKSDTNSLEYKDYQEKHDRVNDLITAFRISLAIKDAQGNTQEERIDESIKAITKFLTKNKTKQLPKHQTYSVNTQNKKLKVTTSVMIASIVVIGILTLTVFLIQQEHAKEMRKVIITHKELLLEQQLNAINSMIYQQFQSMIDISNLHTLMFTKGYDYADDTREFIDKIIDDVRLTDLFVPNIRISDISAYVYVMEPDPQCEFLLDNLCILNYWYLI